MIAKLVREIRNRTKICLKLTVMSMGHLTNPHHEMLAGVQLKIGVSTQLLVEVNKEDESNKRISLN